MTSLANDFRSWILSRAALLSHAVPGCTVESPDDEHVRIITEKATANVNFYELDPGAPEIVELNIIPTDDPDNPTFFLHFEMDDLEHAQQLFDELTDTLSQLTTQKATRILLSCTSGLTTSFFAKKLAEVAATLSLDYEFEAKPIVQALEVAGEYEAVMLAPQVHMSRDEMVGRHPDLVVFEIPGAVFGSYDAGTALRMLLNAMSENALAARLEQADTRIVRRLDNDKRILVVSAVYGVSDSFYSYRVYDHGEVVLDGCVEKPGRSYCDVKDVLATVHLQGIDICDLDAIGLALPGVVDGSTVHMVTMDIGMPDFAKLSEKLGVPIFVDNNANAAAVGCYVSQDRFENVLLQRQPTGYTVGGQGLVIDGRLVRGSHGLAGEPGYLINHLTGEFDKRDYLRSIVWSSEGMLRIVLVELLCAITTTSPEVIYVAVDQLPDMGELHDELAKILPEGTVPELVHVCDYHERVLVGEYALCVNALRKAGSEE
ncbi:MAG: ROK family protein [Atopobiaceae bacterium]|nr:ROK family protein [Atopobiaceae bacterium]